MNNAIEYAREIQRKINARDKSKSIFLKKDYGRAVTREINELKYYCKAKELNFDVVWKKAKEGD